MKALNETVINSKNETLYETENTTQATEDLLSCIVAKKIHRCTWVRTIKDTCNYDGTRTIKIFENCRIKRIFLVKD
mgnify:CR=1 FL=1